MDEDNIDLKNLRFSTLSIDVVDTTSKKVILENNYFTHKKMHIF